MSEMIAWPWLFAVLGGAVLLGIGIAFGMSRAAHATRAQRQASEDGARRLYGKEAAGNGGPHAAAYRRGEAASPDEAQPDIRPAGPEAMHDPPDEWDETDEASDESFPASDPPQQR